MGYYEDLQLAEVMAQRNAAREECAKLKAKLKELEPRLMPVGYEWPRYEDDEQVVIGGDAVANSGEKIGERFTVKRIWFEDGKAHMRGGNCYWHQKASDRKVKRPPVLAADGEPLEVGQTVWHVSNDIEFTVVSILNSEDCPAVKLRLNDDGSFTALGPSQLTHQRPVLDFDGVPIKVGDTVWADSGEKLTVMGIDNLDKGKVGTSGGVYYAESLSHKRPVLDADGVPILEGDEVYLKYGASAYRVAYLPEDDQGRVDIERDGTMWHYMPDQLTHAKPEPRDSWERIEEDALHFVEDNFGMPHDQDQMDRDILAIVRRCKRLAGRSE